MAKTRHIQKRMNQRGITGEMLKSVEKFGVKQGDKCVLNRKGIEQALKVLENTKKQLLRIQNKGGLVLVSVDDSEITAYSLESYRRNG